MKNDLVFAATALSVALLSGGCQRSHPAAAVEERPVRAYTVCLHSLPLRVVASGAIEAIDKADVAFMVPGRVLAVTAEDGAMVRKGQVLARLDSTDYEKNVAIAEAQLDEIKSRHARLSRLHEAGSLTDTDFDKIESALKQATSGAELAHRQLGYTELHAPFDGWVVKRGVAPGVVVSPGIPQFTVLSPGAVWANLGVSEAEMAKVHPGQAVEVSVTASKEAPERGTIEAILPNADTHSRTFAIKVRLENREGRLRHGNVAVGQILTGGLRHALTVPPKLVQKAPDGSLFVWKIDSVRSFALRQLVEVGRLTDTEVEIVAGLKEGDHVVLNVPHTLFEGARLTVAK